MTDEDLRWLNQNRESDDLLPADYVIDGELFEDVGLRYRGGTTRDFIKKNYKVSADNDDPFPPNRTKINLQADWRFPSLLREKLSYDAFSSVTDLRSTADYVHFERNGRFIGPYLDVEQVDEYFLEKRGREGSLWKANVSDCRRLAELSDYYQRYHLKIGTYSDYNHLDELCRVVNESPDDLFRTEILDYLDIAGFLDYYAVQTLLANYDYVQTNYYLLRDSHTGLFEFIPWDLETGWTRYYQPIPYGTAEHPRYGLIYNRLYDRMMTTPQYMRMLHVRLRELLNDPFLVEALLPAIEDDHALLRPEMERDLYKRGRESMAVFDSDSLRLPWFAERRRASILEQLSTWAADPTVNLFVNETVLRNVAGATDEAGDHDPWVEIHNFGNEIVELGGLFLSDDPDEPTKWRFPAGSPIAPRAYLQIWLDGEPSEGALHTSFRAGVSTDALLISKAWGEIIDRLDLFEVSLADVPIARTPDAGASVAPLAIATPCAPNDPTPLTSVSLEMSESDYFPGDSVLVDLDITNHREFSRSLNVEVAWVIEDREQLLFELAFEIDGGELYSQRLDGIIPNTAPPIPFVLVATLRDDLGRVADEDRIDGRIRDPRPIDISVNEIMASNDTTIADEAGQFDDWIELYNPGPRSVDLGGLYLSDNSNDPRKWPIPSVVIAPGDHLEIWCDDDTEHGLMHAPFKLSADGEEIGIYDLDLRGNGVIDRVVFPRLGSDVAYGRSPDGSENIIVLPWATPGESNP